MTAKPLPPFGLKQFLLAASAYFVVLGSLALALAWISGRWERDDRWEVFSWSMHSFLACMICIGTCAIVSRQNPSSWIAGAPAMSIPRFTNAQLVLVIGCAVLLGAMFGLVGRFGTVRKASAKQLRSGTEPAGGGMWDNDLDHPAIDTRSTS